MAARVSKAELLNEALELSADERAELAADLLATLDGPVDASAEEAWRDEARRRVGKTVAGQSSSTPWPELQERLRGRWGA
jgi:putative addiction module component (TIGR02574 family)